MNFNPAVLSRAFVTKLSRTSASVIHGPPQLVPLIVDLHEDFVQMPPPAAGFHALDPALADLGNKHQTEAMPPKIVRIYY